ncbi:MAG: hypothetical protein USCGTAYLOR_02961 [Chromatiales bacterium USCg_Taylor]|nr:MAG: hypothetical protein USCGTAYLOR_02961 [Chromatiales bacterium USCg_Taylor]
MADWLDRNGLSRDQKGEAFRGDPQQSQVDTFTDACRIAEWLGFERKGGKGSHCTYGREGEPLMLNFQNCGGYIKPYQAKQLDEMVKKYGAHT